MMIARSWNLRDFLIRNFSPSSYNFVIVLIIGNNNIFIKEVSYLSDFQLYFIIKLLCFNFQLNFVFFKFVVIIHQFASILFVLIQVANLLLIGVDLLIYLVNLEIHFSPFLIQLSDHVNSVDLRLRLESLLLNLLDLIRIVVFILSEVFNVDSHL